MATRPVAAFVWAAVGLGLLSGCCATPSRWCGPKTSRCAQPAACPPRASRTAASTEPARVAPPMAQGDETVWEYFRTRYDRDGDERIGPDEYERGAETFARLDRDRDGTITEADFARSRRQDERTAQRVLVRAFQADENARDLHRTELQKRFGDHDTDGDGLLGEAELTAALASAPPAAGKPTKNAYRSLLGAADEDASGALSLAELEAFFASQDGNDDGVWELDGARRDRTRPPSGVAPGAPAPDFTLSSPDGFRRITLSAFAGKKPVALIFGSYT